MVSSPIHRPDARRQEHTPTMAETQEKVICSLIEIGKTRDRKQILRDINLSFFYGAKIGVLGLNGAGKSTLLRILAGVEPDFEGRRILQPGLRIGLLEQEPRLDEGLNVRQAVEEGAADILALLEEFNQVSDQLAEDLPEERFEALLHRQGELQDAIEARGGWEIESRLEMAMDALRCPPGDTPVKVLSGGERRRVALCRLLLTEPDILLLDEPTNHLDAESIAWLEQHLDRYPGTVIAVTHDRYFLDNVAGWILELDRGHGIPWKGNYSSWLEQKQARLKAEERAESARQKALARELEWVRRSPSGRQRKPRARVRAYEQAASTETEKLAKDIEIFIPPGPDLGDRVIEADRLTKAYDGTLLFENLSFELPPGSILGIIGPNGAGKTTLFRIITGAEQPDNGSITLGQTVKLAYVEQSRDALRDDMAVWEAMADGKESFELGGMTINARAYAARFNFTGQDQQKKVGMLSGGERNRVHLARMLKSGANVLLMDEPTNDLDVNTIRALEDALEQFAGWAVIISHDRWFLDRVASHTLAFEGDSEVVFFHGNYSEYEEDRRRRLGADADRPHRIKYRKLTRS